MFRISPIGAIPSLINRGKFLSFVLCRPYGAGMNDMFCIYKGFVPTGPAHESVSTSSAIKHSVLPQKSCIIAFSSLVDNSPPVTFSDPLLWLLCLTAPEERHLCSKGVRCYR